MKRRTELVTCGLLMGLAGCLQDIDVKMQRVREDKLAVDMAMTAAMTKFTQGATDIADKKHQLQRQVIDERWQDFVSRNTVSGKVTVPADLLIAEVQNRDKALLTLEVSAKSWREYVGEIGRAISTFEAASNSIAREEADVFAAKQSVQAALTSALTALGSAASGAGVMLLAVP